MKPLIIVRGGGDLATGTVYKLKKAGFPVLILETKYPSAIRTTVAFSQAMYDGSTRVEDMECIKADSLKEAKKLLEAGELCILEDPQGTSIEALHPAVVVDAILAKKNLGTHKEMAPVTIALGPGFTAGKDVDYVIETKRGHQLGRILESGQAIANTGIPGMIAGVGKERVIHAPAKGVLHQVRHIGDLVKQGEIIAWIEDVPVTASISGLLRGLIPDGYEVFQGMKIADIDPRKEEIHNYLTISDKARCIAGGVLEAVLRGVDL